MEAMTECLSQECLDRLKEIRELLKQIIPIEEKLKEFGIKITVENAKV